MGWLKVIGLFLQVGFELLKYWLDPDRQKRVAEEKQIEEDKEKRHEFAKALSNKDPLTVSHHIDQLMREVRSNRAPGREGTSSH